MTIRPTEVGDVDAVLAIIDDGRKIMRGSGNFSQWPEGYPARENILKDIELLQSYVVEDGGRLVATFVLQLGQEPTYKVIYGGKWGFDEEYGTIHRIAKLKSAPSGIFEQCLSFCMKMIGYIRIDTHEDNVIMGKILSKNGFVQRGTIYLRDGSPRTAYDFRYVEKN